MGEPTDVRTLVLSDTLCVHAMMAGTVAVKRSHRENHGPSALRFPALMADWRWTEPLPIWTWAIEHRAGNFLIDTGENISVRQADYLDCGGMVGRINRKILRLSIQKSQHVSEQLGTVGLAPEDVEYRYPDPLASGPYRRTQILSPIGGDRRRIGMETSLRVRSVYVSPLDESPTYKLSVR